MVKDTFSQEIGTSNLEKIDEAKNKMSSSLL